MLGGGNHGNIKIIMWNTLYVIISLLTYDAPVGLIIIETVPLQATTEKFPQLQDWHDEALHIHSHHKKKDMALHKMVIKTVKITYIFTLHNVFTWYMGLPTKDTINHLMDWYRCITINGHQNEAKTPPRTLGHVTMDQCFFQGRHWQITITQWGKHTTYVGTSFTNGL